MQPKPNICGMTPVHEESSTCSSCGNKKDELHRLYEAAGRAYKIYLSILEAIESKIMDEVRTCLNCGAIKAHRDMPYQLGAGLFLCSIGCSNEYMRNVRNSMSDESCICAQCGKFTIAVAINKDDLEQLRKATEQVFLSILRSVETKFMEQPCVCINCGLIKIRKEMLYPLGGDTFCCGIDCFKAYTKNTREGYA